MILEWLRRRWGVVREMDTYLYTEAPITEVEEAEEASGRDREVAHRLARMRPGRPWCGGGPRASSPLARCAGRRLRT